LGTPYHHMGRVKCAGTDCLMMLAEVCEAAGVVPHIEVPFYPADWNLHHGAERYLDGVMRHAIEISGPPQPGDVAVFRFGCCYAHGAIVVEWPRIIHAWVAVGVIYGDAAQPKLASHKPCFLDPFVNILVEPK
jgi:cell wall-associated NlpC family hydrolase